MKIIITSKNSSNLPWTIRNYFITQANPKKAPKCNKKKHSLIPKYIKIYKEQTPHTIPSHSMNFCSRSICGQRWCICRRVPTRGSMGPKWWFSNQIRHLPITNFLVQHIILWIIQLFQFFKHIWHFGPWFCLTGDAYQCQVGYCLGPFFGVLTF